MKTKWVIKPIKNDKEQSHLDVNLGDVDREKVSCQRFIESPIDWESPWDTWPVGKDERVGHVDKLVLWSPHF